MNDMKKDAKETTISGQLDYQLKSIREKSDNLGRLGRE
jgi:hypothetical protein